MWFIFQQIRGLGRSEPARFYGIGLLNEARAYLAHPLLVPRLVQRTESLLTLARSLDQIFGSPDDMKFCSRMTLFDLASEAAESPFRFALQRYCEGRADERTLALLEAEIGSA